MSTSRLFAMLSLMMLAAVMSFFVSIQPAAAQESSPSQLRLWNALVINGANSTDFTDDERGD